MGRNRAISGDVDGLGRRMMQKDRYRETTKAVNWEKREASFDKIRGFLTAPTTTRAGSRKGRCLFMTSIPWTLDPAIFPVPSNSGRGRGEQIAVLDICGGLSPMAVLLWGGNSGKMRAGRRPRKGSAAGRPGGFRRAVTLAPTSARHPTRPFSVLSPSTP